MAASSSIAARALLAVALMIGFYLLALAISIGLLYIPYAEVVHAHRIHLKLTIFCVLGALAILWSILPRWDRFEAPGPLLSPEQQPRLFAEVESVAQSVGQAMPAEVYLVHDVNAWVSQRGGVMGFGSRRVMGLGLPLMRILTVSGLRAVLAHEFGHYHGGDTKLGPWVYKTRGAIGRTLASLSGEDGEGSLLQLPFLWYGKLFLRISHAVSRHQEFVADELAARTVGSAPLIAGLRAVHGIGSAFEVYWANECAPVLGAGFRPPLIEGFQKFVETGEIAQAIQKQLEEAMGGEKADPYDTHPSLKERIEALAHLPAGEATGFDPWAITLLADVPGLESHLLAALTDAETAAKLQPISWRDVAAHVYQPQWVKLVKANAAVLEGLTAESLLRVAANAKMFGSRCVHPSGAKPEEEDTEAMAGTVIGAALALLMLARGGSPEALPGQAVTVAFGSVKLEPFGLLRALAEGKCGPATWRQQCVELGLVGVDLGQFAATVE